MKKLIASVLVLVCMLGLCIFGLVVFNVPRNGPSINYIIENTSSITGIVKEVNEDTVLIENETGEYWVPVSRSQRKH